MRLSIVCYVDFSSSELCNMKGTRKSIHIHFVLKSKQSWMDPASDNDNAMQKPDVYLLFYWKPIIVTRQCIYGDRSIKKNIHTWARVSEAEKCIKINSWKWIFQVDGGLSNYCIPSSPYRKFHSESSQNRNARSWPFPLLIRSMSNLG